MFNVQEEIHLKMDIFKPIMTDGWKKSLAINARSKTEAMTNSINAKSNTQRVVYY